MAKYHINPTTGNPGLCTAEKRPCPHGLSAEEHFPTKWQAMKAYEEGQASAPAPLTKAVKQEGKPQLSEEAERKLALKRELTRTAAVEELRQGFKKHSLSSWRVIPLASGAYALEGKQGEALRSEVKTLSTLGLVKREFSLSGTNIFTPTDGQKVSDLKSTVRKLVKDYSNPETEEKPRTSDDRRQEKVELKRVLTQGRGLTRARESYPTINAGKLNPLTAEGSGSEVYKPSEREDSLTILAHSDGTGARVVSSSGELLREPEAELGTPVVQFKQVGHGRDTETHDLRVVGYVDKEGRRFGYVPNKQLSFFVMK